MHAIPETGAGFSGFIAHYLWLVYMHFPSAGQWDWLLLFLILSLGMHFFFLPYLWESVKADMTILQEGRAISGSQGIVVEALYFSCLIFFIWFFSTSAGQTFLNGRQLLKITDLTTVHRGLFWVSLIAFYFILLSIFTNLVDKVAKRAKTSGARKSQPYFKRDFLTLYSGGGVFVLEQKDSSTIQPTTANTVVIELIVIFFLPLFYWYWSVASLILMQCFFLSAILTEGFRVLFVYILHKRTFK